MIHPTLSEGDRVMLDVPVNPRIHGKEGRVLKVTEYGALIATDAAATGQFRAGWGEMTLFREAGPDDTVVETLARFKGIARPLSAVDRERLGLDLPPVVNPLRNGGIRQARESGYTGSVCPTCQGCRMTRNGSCEKCEDCGTTSGCS